MVLEETKDSHIFETKNLCVNVGVVGQEDEYPTKVVKKEEADARVSQRNTNKDRNQSNEESFPAERIGNMIQDEKNVMLKVVDCDTKVVMAEDVQMPHEGITRDEEVEEKHLYVVLIDFEAELRLLEKWLEKHRTDEKVAKEDESQPKFQNPSGEIEDRLQGSPLKEEKNEGMVGEGNWERKYSSQPFEGGPGMKTTMEDVGRNIRGSRGT